MSFQITSGSIESAFIWFAIGAVTSFFLYGDVFSKKNDRHPDEDEEDDDGEEETTITAASGLKDFSVFHAPFKMILCVNMSLQMGKGM